MLLPPSDSKNLNDPKTGGDIILADVCFLAFLWPDVCFLEATFLYMKRSWKRGSGLNPTAQGSQVLTFLTARFFDKALVFA
jgi:hypothetical protein